MNNSCFTWIALMVAVAISGAGCKEETTVHQTTTTHINGKLAGHQVAADISGDATMDPQPDRAVITCDFGKVVIESNRVSLGTNEWTKIPEGVPLTLNFTQDKYSVTWPTNN